MLPSVQLYSVREELAEDFPGTLRRLRDAGFRRVEPFGLAESADLLRTYLADAGLEAPSTHAGVFSAPDPAALFGLAAELGIRTVIEPHWGREHWQEVDDIRRTAERLNDLSHTAREQGVRLGYHNHEFEAEPRFLGRTGLELLVETLDPEVVLEVDTYWVQVGGTDPAALLHTLGERVALAHLKDGPATRVTKDQLPLGRGVIDVPTVLAAAPHLELGVIEFDDYSGNVLEGVADSLRYLEGLAPTTGAAR